VVAASKITEEEAKVEEEKTKIAEELAKTQVEVNVQENAQQASSSNSMAESRCC